jgi:hypothetical protein
VITHAKCVVSGSRLQAIPQRQLAFVLFINSVFSGVAVGDRELMAAFVARPPQIEDFDTATRDAMNAGARHLWKRGYR